MEVVGRCSGVVLMAPPDDSSEARATIATLLSALKSKQKVPGCPIFHGFITTGLYCSPMLESYSSCLSLEWP